MTEKEINDLVNGESIRIRFTKEMKQWLFEEKQRTGKPVSELVRSAVKEMMDRK